MAYTYDVTETDPILLEEERKRRRKKRAEALGLTEEEFDVAEAEKPAPEEKPPEPPPTPPPPVVEGEPSVEFILQGRKAPEFPPETFKPPQAPRDELPALLERVFPEKFRPGETSYGYTKEQLVPVVTDQLRAAMQADFKAFQYDAYRRVGQDEGERLLRALGASERAILQGYGANMQEQRIVNTIRAVLPDVSTLDQFQELIDTDRKAFARKVLDGGITPEKQRLLDLMNTNQQEIQGLLLDRIVAEVDGVRKQVVRDDDNQVYDDRGQWLGWYDWGTKAVFNPYKETALFGKAKASITAGVGDLLSTAGGAARWLGQEDIGASLSARGKELQQFGQPAPADFQTLDLLDPEFYATKIARTIPFAVSLAPVAVGSFYAGSALAGAAGLGALGTMLVAGLGSGALNRAAEGALEAGSQYDDAIARGKTEAEAKKEANEVFTNNMKLAGMDAWQIAIALAPTPKWVPKALVNSGLAKVARVGGKMVIVGLSEGGEEVYQSMVQRHAAGEEWRLDPVDKEVFAIGAVMGLGMGLGGDVVQSIVNKSKGQMPTDLRNTFDSALSGGKSELQALNEVAKTPEGQSLIQKIIHDERGSAEIGPRGKPEGEVPKAPEVPKEPWQMTQKDALIANKGEILASLKEEIPANIKQAQSEIVRLESEIAKNPSNPANGQLLDVIGQRKKFIVTQEQRLTEGFSEKFDRFWNLRHKQDVAKALSEGKPVPESVLKDYPDLAKAVPKAEVKPTAKALPEAKEPWQMTREEFQQHATLLEKQRVGARIPTALEQGKYPIKGEWAEMTKGWHKQEIEKALAEGKPVPPEVLKDYPDLKVPKAEVKPTTPIPEAKPTNAEIMARLPRTDQIGSTMKAVPETISDIGGFEQTLSPANRAKALTQMNEKKMIAGKPQTRKEYIEDAVSKGAIVGIKEGKSALVFPDGRYIRQSEITKTALDYADYLKAKPTTKLSQTWNEPFVRTVGKDFDAEFLHGTKRSNIPTLTAGERPVSSAKKDYGIILPKEMNEFNAELLLSEKTQAQQAVMWSHGKGETLAVVKVKDGTKVLDLSDEVTRAGTFGTPKILRFFTRPAITDDLIQWELKRIVPEYRVSHPNWEKDIAGRIDPNSPAFDVQTWQDLLVRYAKDKGYGLVRFADETLVTDRSVLETTRRATASEIKAAQTARKYPGSKEASLFTDTPTGTRGETTPTAAIEGQGVEAAGVKEALPAKPPTAEVPPVKPPAPETAVTPTPEPKPTPVQRVREFYKAKIADLEATTRDKIASLKDWAKYNVSERDRVKNILTDYVQANLPLEERGKLLDAVKNVSNQAQLDEVIARVDRLGEVTEQKRLRTEINKELSKTKPKKVEGILKGKYTAEFQDWLDTVKANIGMDRDEARTRIAEVIQQHAENKISEDAMQEQIAILKLAGIDGMSSAELQEVLTDIQDMKTIGRTLNQANQEKLKADIAAVKEKAVNEVTGGKGLKPGTGVLDARELEAKTNFVGKLTDSQLGFGNLLDEISKLSGTQPYQSTLSKFERTVQEARNKENSGRKLYQKAIIQNFAKIYGLKDAGHINAKLNQIENEKVDLGTFRVVIDGKAQQIHMVKTKAQIIQHYLWQQDPTLTDTYKEGMHWTYEINNAMANALNDQDVAFADWLIQEFYPEYYPTIDKINRELYGIRLPYNPFYSPGVRDFDSAVPENVMFYKDAARYASVTASGIHARVKNILPLRDTSVLANLINHVEQMEHFKAWSMPMRTMRRVFGDKTVRTAIQQYHGRPVMTKIDHYLDLFARGGVDRVQIIRGLDKLRGNFATAVLGLKPHIAIQQIPTILGYTTEMPIGDFFEGVGDFWKNPIQNYQWILKNSTYIQNRYEAGFERDIRTATTKKALTEWSGKGSFTEKVYALIEGGDKLGVIPGWWAKYKSGLKHGLSEKEAMLEADLATNRTQNTSDIETLSSLQNGGSFMKILTMFQNQPNKYFRIMADNARNFKYGRGTKAKAVSNILMVAVVLPALYTIIANAFRIRKDDIYKAAVLSPINNLLIFGQMAQAIEGWIAGDTFGYRASPVLDSIQEIQNAISKARKLVAAGQDPYKDISMDDVVALTEFVAKAGGQLTGLPTPYLVNVERALRGTEGKRDLRELVYSRWALREPEKDVHEKLAESQGKLGQTIEYSQKQLDAMAKAGQKITPKVTDMKVLDGEFRKILGNTLPVDITEKNGYIPMAVAWAQKEIARGQSDILPNIKLKDYFKEDYDDFSPRQYVEQYQASLRIKSLQELKEYASVYPRYYLGNLTARQLEAMEKFATLSKPEQEQYLEVHLELSLNPRQEWLKAHPDENAQLAVWGQAKVLTRAAYDNAVKMVNDLDIPDSAIEGHLPPKDVAKDYFTYNDAVDKFGANSPQARVVRLNDKLNGWLELERIDESKKSLDLKVKTYDKSKEYAAFSDKDSPNYKDDVVKDAEGKTARDKAQEQFKAGNQSWLEDLDRIEAHSKGTRDNPTPDDVVQKWAEHGKVARAKKGYEAEEKVWYLDNPTIHKWALDNKLTKDDGLKWNEPVLRIQVKAENRKIEQQIAEFKEKYPSVSDKKDPNYKSGYEYHIEQLMDSKAGQAYQDDRNRIYAHQNNGKEFAEAIVNYGKVAREFGGSSSEAKLFRYNDQKFNTWGTDKTFEGGNKWEPLDTSKVPIWKIDAQYRKQDEAYEAIKFPGDDRKQAAEREKYLKANPQYRVARIQRGGYELGLRDVKQWTEYNQLPEYGFWRERYRRDNPDFDKSVLAAQKAKGQTPWMPVTAKIPAVQYDQLYQQYKAKFDAYENVEGNDDQRRQIREAMLKADPKFAEARITRNAYGLLIGNEKYVPEYVNYYKILAANLPLDNYDDDWYLMEHPAFYNTMLKALDWKTRDFSKVPTRPVWQKYQRFLGLVEGKPRDDFRFANPDLEAWLQKKFGYKPITEKKRRAELSSSERLAEEVQKRQKRLAGIGAR